jgi:hypothetical protein
MLSPLLQDEDSKDNKVGVLANILQALLGLAILMTGIGKFDFPGI